MTPGSEDDIRIRHYSKGKFYLIECPDGTKVVRCALQSASDSTDSHDHLVVPFRGQELVIPADPPELLPLLADAGQYGLSLVGEPVPDVNLAGAVCPNCNEDDVSVAVSRGRLEHRSLRELRM